MPDTPFPTIDLSLWGKSRDLPGPYPVICHLLDTGAILEELWDTFLTPGIRAWFCEQLHADERDARALVAFWGALHDVCKVTSSFQRQTKHGIVSVATYPRVPPGSYRHDKGVHDWLPATLRDLWHRPGLEPDDYCRLVGQLLGGHHGVFHAPDKRTVSAPTAYERKLGKGEWEQQRRNIVTGLHLLFGAPQPSTELPADAAALICALVMLADWLASQVSFIEPRLANLPPRGDRASLAAHLEESRRLAPAVVRAAQLDRATVAGGAFAEEFPFEPNDLQRSVAEHLPGLLDGGAGLLLVLVSTGEGKSETSWHAGRLMGEACGRCGFFLGLPTMATADQAFDRLTEYLNRRATSRSALTLLHSMAWLNKSYNPATGEPGASVSSDDVVLVEEWLRGYKRGLLANWALGTVDQSLMGVLKARHNVLRMLALANKAVIIDEVHAYDAYMQGLLLRLLTWLGRTGTPVILLSATVSGRIATRLVKAYLDGAGHELKGKEIVQYPGWAYASARTGEVTPYTVKVRERELVVDARPVAVDKNKLRRMSVLETELAPMLAGGTGTAAVICTTVAEAQDTYEAVTGWVRTEGAADRVDVWLLHSRFTVEDREAITRTALERLGKKGWGANGRRRATILISTQIIEQSLDIDVDLMISDLAPIALLLQRAGREQRHTAEQLEVVPVRPDWAAVERLVVLVPTSQKQELLLPKTWIYPEALMRRTLATLPGKISIPGDVQGLIDGVYDAVFTNGDLEDDDLAHIAEESVRSAAAKRTAIPVPRDVLDLSQLTADLNEEQLGTRWGADSARIVCFYRDEDGGHWLDRDAAIPVPGWGSDTKLRLSPQQAAAVVAKSVPVSGTWVKGVSSIAPPCWEKDFRLRSMIAVECELPNAGAPTRVVLGDRMCELDGEYGLHER